MNDNNENVVVVTQFLFGKLITSNHCKLHNEVAQFNIVTGTLGEKWRNWLRWLKARKSSFDLPCTSLSQRVSAAASFPDSGRGTDAAGE